MTDNPKSGIPELLHKSRLYPQEEMAMQQKGKDALFIGIPKEVSMQEKRLALSPDGVKLLTSYGHEVWVENGAGKSSNFTDHEFSEAGARIVYSHKEVFEAKILLKVEPPTAEEIEFLNPGHVLISALPLGNVSRDYFIKLNEKKVTAIGYELIEDKVGGMPAVRAMSEIAGSVVMLIGAEYLSNARDGKGIVLGGITGVPSSKVAILGAGTVAEYAARAALGLGVDIQIFDDHIYKLRRLKHALGHQVHTCSLNSSSLKMALLEADVVIGALRAEKGRIRYMVSEEIVSQMKHGSVIVDVSIDQGGCFETSRTTTHDDPVYEKYGVIHYCVPNIASRVSSTATTALNNIFTPILLQIADNGSLEEMLFNESWFRKGVYAYKASLTNANIARRFSMPFKDLNLLMAARI